MKINFKISKEVILTSCLKTGVRFSSTAQLRRALVELKKLDYVSFLDLVTFYRKHKNRDRLALKERDGVSQVLFLSNIPNKHLPYYTSKSKFFKNEDFLHSNNL